MFGKKARERRKARRERRRKRNAASAAQQPKTQSTLQSTTQVVSDDVTTQSSPLEQTTTQSSDGLLGIREIFNQDKEVVAQPPVGNFEEIAQIRIKGQYPQNYVDIPTYDLSKLNIVLNPSCPVADPPEVGSDVKLEQP